MRNYVSVGIALSKPMLERIDRLAAKKGVPRNDLFRRLLDMAMPFAEGNLAPDIARILTQQEHQALLLDHIVRQRNPEAATKFAQAAQDAAKKHHGA